MSPDVILNHIKDLAYVQPLSSAVILREKKSSKGFRSQVWNRVLEKRYNEKDALENDLERLHLELININ